MNRIWIDGVDFTDYVDTTTFEFIYGLNTENKTFAFQTSEQVTLVEEGFQFIKDKFFRSCNQKENKAIVKIYIENCKSTFATQIAYEDVEICLTSCEAHVTLTELDNECYKQLNETVFWDEGFLDAYEHPVVGFVRSPGFSQWGLFLIFPLLSMISIALAIIFDFFVIICNILRYVTAPLGFVSSLVDSIFGGDADIHTNSERGAYAEQLALNAEDPDARKAFDLYYLITTPARCDEVLTRWYPSKDEAWRTETCNRLLGLSGDDLGKDIFLFDCPSFIALDELVCRLAGFIGGTGYAHKAPLLREVFEYQANKCGLQFISSVFQSEPYKNTVIFTAEHGGSKRFDEMDEYKPEDTWTTDTVIELAERVCEHMNLEYWVKDGAFHIDSISAFEDDLPTFPITLDEIIDAKIYDHETDICVEFIEAEACAYLRAEYKNDNQDTESNRTAVKRQYDSIVEWNENDDDWKKGNCEVNSSFGRARFMFDRISMEDKGLWKFDLTMDSFRTGDYTEAINTLLSGIIPSIFLDLFVDCEEYERFNDLVMSDDKSELPKLLVLEPNFDRKDAKVIRRELGARPGDSRPFFDYNYPMYFDEDYDLPELYQNFWYLNDPNSLDRKIYRIGSITLPIECDAIGCDIMEFVKANPHGYKLVSKGRYLPLGSYGIPEQSRLKFDEKRDDIIMDNIIFGCVE